MGSVQGSILSFSYFYVSNVPYIHESSNSVIHFSLKPMETGLDPLDSSDFQSIESFYLQTTT